VSICENTFAYTNHTAAPEALETWPVDLFGRLLPRHLEIIYEINRRFLETVRRKHPDEPELEAELSLVQEGSSEEFGCRIGNRGKSCGERRRRTAYQPS